MQFCILTVDRSPNPNYLNQTINALRLARKRYRHWLDIDIVLGAPGENHLAPNLEEWLRSRPLAVQEASDLRHLTSPTQRHAYNYIRILKDCDEPLLVLEDDAVVTPDFFFHLKNLLQSCNEIGSEYVVSLFDSRVEGRGLPALEIEPVGGFGTVAVYFSKLARMLLRDRTYERYLRGRQINRGIDVHLRQEAALMRVPFYRPTARIVSHVGHISTGCQGIRDQV